MTAEFKPGSAAAWTHAGDDLSAEAPPADERYTSGGELGRGGMGVVRSASDSWLDRDVAVKRPHADLSEDLRNRLMREAKITARLAHPGIVPIYDVGFDEDGPFYTMPVLVGRTLEAHIEDSELGLSAMVRSLASTCRAVAYAHTHGVIHRDLKPANVLLGAYGEVWVMDWGVALDPEVPDNAVVGSRGFQSPEQLAGTPVGPAADVWSLGATLEQILRAQAEPQPELAAVVRRCCEDDPNKRYSDGGALADELERWLDGQRVAAHDYSAGEVMRRLAVQYRAPLAVGGVALIALAIVIALAFSNQRIERDRALAAEVQSEAARQQADASLSVSLAQQAQTLQALNIRPEAEVLAARSLELTDNPLARGVLMAWAGTPRTPLMDVIPSPCETPWPARDGGWLCTGDSLTMLDSSGNQVWSTDAPAPEIDGTPVGWAGEYRDVRAYQDGTVLLLRSSNVLEVWFDGARVSATAALWPVQLADGDIPAVTGGGKVGLVDGPAGTTTWSEPTCSTVIETAFIGQKGVVVACKEAAIFTGTLPKLDGPTILDSHVSAITWADGFVLGTFQGQLLTPDGDGWAISDAGVGGIRQLETLPEGQLVAVGERGRARIWSASNRIFLGSLPGRVGRVRAVGDVIAVMGDELHRYKVQDNLLPVRFDRSNEGGLAYLSVGPSGQRLLAGSASGDIVTWTHSGSATTLNTTKQHIARAGVLLDDRTAMFSEQPGGLFKHDLVTGDRTLEMVFLSRHLVALDEGYGYLSYDNALRINTETYILPAPATAMTTDRPYWITDQEGGVHRLGDDGVSPQFTLDRSARAVVQLGTTLILAEGTDIVARDFSGAEQWRWTGITGITAMHATADWIAIGDGDGRLSILNSTGQLVASVAGHDRLISGVQIRGDVVFTGSWDGTARRWGLQAATADGAALSALVQREWGLDVDQALAGADRR